MSKFSNLIGTVLDRFQFGLSGPLIKSETGQLSARNADDTDYAALRAALVRVFGDSIELNAGASGSGADHVMRLVRPGTGMTTDIDIVLPTGVPSPDDELYVVSYATGVVTLGYRASGSDAATNVVHVDETDLAFGSSSPLALLTKPANALVEKVKVIIDTPFDGGNPQVSIGIPGNTSKYGAASHIDLTAPAGTVFELDYGLEATGSTEDIIATYAGDSSAAGAARIQIFYVIPS